MTESASGLRQWVAVHFGCDSDALDWQVISGDAGSRCYYRLFLSGQHYVVMDSSIEPVQLSTFVAIAGRLRQSGLRAPRIYAANQENGYALLEDFGDEMLRDQLSVSAGDKLFAALLPLLKTMATGTDIENLPLYSAELLRSELSLFPDWYMGRHCDDRFTESEQQQWLELVELLVDSAVAQPQVFVHRDFHSCNLHNLADGQIGLIDFQDALLGPLSYDLVSWLWDRYQPWTREQQLRWMLQFYHAVCDSGLSLDVTSMTDKEWIRCCDLMGLQRNLKIIGIFARLNYRDGKSGYLQLIPQFCNYARDALAEYPELEPFRVLLEPRL